MKQLEDRIKDRLEGYESSLPEGDLAEFKALLDASATAGKKRSPAYLAWFAPVAVAAGLALFFVFGHGPQQDMIQVVDGSSMVADVVEAQPEVAAVQTYPSTSRNTIHPDAMVVVNENLGSNQQAGHTEHKGEQKRNNDDISVGSSAEHSPFIPSAGNSRKPVSVKVGKAAAGVIGGSGITALAGVLPGLVVKSDFGQMDSEIVNPGDIMMDPEPPVDKRTWNDIYHMPLRTGISVRIPLNDRWSITTGLDYSWYASEIEYSLSGVHKQSAHYLGIPLRADLTIARNRWMDVYVGAGGSVDFCVAAYDAGQKMAKDGVGFSLIGSGGIQFNISKNLGLFLDPTLSWDMTSGNRTLDTYRSEHPFMFAVSSGLRITVPTKKY